jgi:hypothetical protein
MVPHTLLFRLFNILNNVCKILHNCCLLYETTNCCLKLFTTRVVYVFKQQLFTFYTHKLFKNQFKQPNCVNILHNKCLIFVHIGCVIYLTIQLCTFFLLVIVQILRLNHSLFNMNMFAAAKPGYDFVNLS